MTSAGSCVPNGIARRLNLRLKYDICFILLHRQAFLYIINAKTDESCRIFSIFLNCILLIRGHAMPVHSEIRKKQRNKISLATLFTGLVSLSVLLTLTILLIGSYHLKKSTLIDTTLTSNYAAAAKMSQTIDYLFKSMRSSLQYSSTLLADVKSMPANEVNSKLEIIRHSGSYFNSIILVDETGLVRNRSPLSGGSVGMYVTTEEARTALAVKEPYISIPYTPPQTHRMIVFLSEPIYDRAGEYRGFIGGTLFLQENNILHSIFGNNPINELGSYFYIVGSNGHILFHPDQSRIGEDVRANPVVGKVIQGHSGQEPVVNLRGVALLAGYVKVPENGWGVVVVSPTSVVNEQIFEHIKAMLLYVLPPFAILMLAAIWLARRLAKPFVALTDVVSKIGKEKTELPKGKHHWNREADLLTKAIRYAIKNIRKQTDQLTHEAMTDPLTGLTNRRTLEATMQQWITEMTPFSVIIMDIDRFKEINDIFGHLAGDEVLKHFADIIVSCVRPGDICCRYGGEEFIALIARANAVESYLVAERIRRTLEESDNPIKRQITVSQGVAHYAEQSESSAEELIRLADQALYKAKRSGRNQTVIA